MSGEHFETGLLKSYSAEGTVFNRTYGMDNILANVYAHKAILDCVTSIENSPMDGISGDLPKHRKQVASILSLSASLVKELAYDCECDGKINQDSWDEFIEEIIAVCKGGPIER